MMFHSANTDPKRTEPLRLWQVARHLDPHGEEREEREDAVDAQDEFLAAGRDAIAEMKAREKTDG